VGQHEALRLHLSDEINADDLAQKLVAEPQILKATAADHQVVLIVTEAEEALPGVIATANALNIKIRSVDIEEPNLEAVFLHLTGRALRD